MRANAVPRRPLFDFLAGELDFELVPGDINIEPVTTQLENGPLRDVLPSLLFDRAYRAAYRVNRATGRHQLSRLEIAPSGATTFVAESGYVVPSYVPQIGSLEPIAAQRQTSNLLSPPAPEDPSQAAATWQALVLRLDDADADERIEALEQIDPEGEGWPLIVDRLTRDPDPRVRTVAAEKLEFADTLASVDALVLSLSDPNKQVVLAAIDALEFTDDHTVTEDLERLLKHADADIREAAVEAIDFIGPPNEE